MAGSEQTIMEALTAELLGDVGKLHDRVKDLEQALPDAAQSIRDAGREAADSIHVAVGKAVGELNHAAASFDVGQVTAHFDLVAGQLLAELRKGQAVPGPAAGPAPAPSKAWSKGARQAVILVGILGCLVGGFVGARVASKTPIDEVTSKQIEAGRDFLQVLPQLDAPTKEKLVRMIQKNRQAAGS